MSLFNRLPLAPVLQAPTHLNYVTTDQPTFTLASQDLDQKDKLTYTLELSDGQLQHGLKDL